jgi:hypothetical protein
MTRLGSTNDPNDAFAADDLALLTHFLDASAYLHRGGPRGYLSLTVSDPAFGQIIRSHLESHFIARNNANVVHAHFPGDVS